MKLPIFLICLSAAILAFWGSTLQTNLKDHDRFLYPPAQLPHFSFGYNESITDSLWIRSLQDLATCDQNGHKIGDPRVDTVEPMCKRGWVYQMLDAMTELTPRFKGPYAYGVTVLSIIVDDREGARLLYEKGLKLYPHDWFLAYRAAYHYLYEVKDDKRAAQLLIQAGKDGAPGWVFSLAAKLYSKYGQAQFGKRILEDALAKNPDSEFAPRLRSRLDELNKIIAKGPEASDFQNGDLQNANERTPAASPTSAVPEK